ncbi:uncharacterized protein PHALS_10434 [Plasmopara halstedii]|uniref:Uncharacterized protein n=1 Tax=Plasmopara halstedii TaxID=4781 RepID=A0A0P1AHI4_PLAHL|nr:uncharacterized protein PHALS_10434 [Plasmopara halstedii]CEG40222.1 hypothetical protein PHALS_10434 [Plasmopara halstedii]|eukprot:XP_024576591.1 hypothetical protein PHALS_10434 [Plasmopara halstedii]
MCVALLRALGNKDFGDLDKKLSPRLCARLHRYSLNNGLLYYSTDSTDPPRIEEPVIPSEQLQLKLKQKYEKMEKQRENSARVDSILIQLMKSHAPEIAEKLEMKNNLVTPTMSENPATATRETDGSGVENVKRQKVA